MDQEAALRVAAAFGGGLARSGGPCGAMSGALMVIGLQHGMVSADAPQAKEHTYKIAQEFVERFRSANGAVDCRELLGHDMSTPEGRQAIKAGKIYADPVQFPDQIGVETARAILKHFAGESVPREILIPTALYRQADAVKDPELK